MTEPPVEPSRLGFAIKVHGPAGVKSYDETAGVQFTVMLEAEQRDLTLLPLRDALSTAGLVGRIW
jgi:hypothetical protein